MGRKIRIGFFCGPGLDNFIKPIVKYFEDYYDVRLETSTDQGKLGESLQWADIIWLEWANEMAAFITHKMKSLIEDKPVIVRIHSYEAVHGLVGKVDWTLVHSSIFVSQHVRNLTSQQWAVMNLKKDHDTYVIYNYISIMIFL